MSEGLEGRSKNPVALLFDTLMQPNEDIGESHPPSLTWTQESHRAISHVILGKGKAGGAWHRMQPDVLSLSTGRWLQLPIFGFEDWKRERQRAEKGEGGLIKSSANGRVELGNVAQYYQRYVEKMGIAENFRDDMTVTQARLRYLIAEKECRSTSCESTFSEASTCNSESEQAPLTQIRRPVCRFNPHDHKNGPTATGNDEECDSSSSDDEIVMFESMATCDSDDTGISCCAKRVCLSTDKRCWLVQGREIADDGQERIVSVCAKNIVLATGIDDAPKKLEVPGEDLDYVRHTFSNISPDSLRAHHPVLVVGAGLAAADAVLHTLSKGLQVIHVFHQDPSDHRLIYHNMDPTVYSEYVTLYRKMCSKQHDPSYTPLARHRVQQFNAGGVCTICSSVDNKSVKTFTVSLALVLIGGQAQLDFLPECILNQLSIDPDKPINAKYNPLDVDTFTFEFEHFPSLFAMGPLVGDNFVRFVLGGAVGIAKKLHEKLCK